MPINVARVQTDSREVNQLQQNIITKIIPFVNGLERVPRYSAATIPTADISWAGKTIRVFDAGTPETLQMCLQNSDGSFAWVTIAVAPL
jgi:hypothetical protein